MSLIRKHGAVLQAWACLDLVLQASTSHLQAVRNPPKCFKTCLQMLLRIILAYNILETFPAWLRVK